MPIDPNPSDKQTTQLAEGFPTMLGSIDLLEL